MTASLATLEDTCWLRPTADFWTRSAQLWVVLPEEDQRFETQPEDLAWMRAGSRAPGCDPPQYLTAAI
jgi:hypothetical protein